MVRTLCFHCRGPGFNPWSGNQDSASHAVWAKKKIFLIKKIKCIYYESNFPNVHNTVALSQSNIQLKKFYSPKLIFTKFPI